MICVTPADLGRPIAAIVERCGAPDSVLSLGAVNQLLYAENGRAAVVFFDADQMRARIIQFFPFPATPEQPAATWTMTLPFAGGPRRIDLGAARLATLQSALATDADVTTQNGAAFHSSPQTDVLLSANDAGQIVWSAAFGERASLVQAGFLAAPIDAPPLDYMSPVARDAWLRPQNASTGPNATIFRVDVDATGVARTVTIVIPSSDAAFDAATKQRLADAHYRPATLDDRPVSGAIFVQVRH